MAATNIGSENFASLQIKIFTKAQDGTPSSDYGVISFDHATERIGINGKWYGTTLKEEYTTLKNLVDKLDGNASTEGSVKKQIADAISNLVNTKIGALTGTNIPGNNNTTVTDFLTSLQSQLTTLNGGTETTGSVDQKIGAAVAKINSDNQDAHNAAVSAVQEVTINDVQLIKDANKNATGTITAGNIKLGGTGTNSGNTVKATIDDIYSQLSTTVDGGTLHLYQGETGTTEPDDKTVHANNTIYRLVQGTKEIAKFKIEKDSFVKEGKLVYGPSTGLNGGTKEDENESDTSVEGKTTPYLKLVIKTTDNEIENHVYIKADRLVDIYTGSTGAAGTGVDITVGEDNKIGATLRIASGTTGTAVTGTATSAAGVTRTSITQVANTVSVTTTNGTVTNANVGAGVSVDVAGAANAAYNDAYNDAKGYVDGLGGGGSTSVTGTQTATASATYSDTVQVLNGVNVTSRGGKVNGVTGTGIYVDKAGAAAKAYSSALQESKEYTNQVITWEVVSE